MKPMASSFEVGAVWRVVGNGIMSLDLSSCPGRFTLPGRFRNALHYLLFQMQREIVRLVLAKYFPFSEKQFKTAFAFVPLLDHNPLAIGSRFDGDRGQIDREANAVNISHSARIVGENREIHSVRRSRICSLSDP